MDSRAPKSLSKTVQKYLLTIVSLNLAFTLVPSRHPLHDQPVHPARVPLFSCLPERHVAGHTQQTVTLGFGGIGGAEIAALLVDAEIEKYEPAALHELACATEKLFPFDATGLLVGPPLPARGAHHVHVADDVAGTFEM